MKTDIKLYEPDESVMEEYTACNNLRFLKLTPEGIQYAASLFGPGKSLSLKEVREMTKEKMAGIRITDVIRQERDMGW